MDFGAVLGHSAGLISTRNSRSHSRLTLSFREVLSTDDGTLKLVLCSKLYPKGLFTDTHCIGQRTSCFKVRRQSTSRLSSFPPSYTGTENY